MGKSAERTSARRSAFSGGGKQELGDRERNYCCTQLLASMLESQAKAADRCCNQILNLQQMGGRQDTELLKVNHSSVFCMKLGRQKFPFAAQDPSLKLIWQKEKG